VVLHCFDIDVKEKLTTIVRKWLNMYVEMSLSYPQIYTISTNNHSTMTFHDSYLTFYSRICLWRILNGTKFDQKKNAQTIQKSLWDEVPLMGVEEIIATVNEEVNITKKIMLLIECNRRSLTGKIIIVLTFANDNRVNIINTNIQQYAR
jgi:hypothetical protein